jgi:hypothetical protein
MASILTSIISFFITFMISVPAAFEDELNEAMKTQDDKEIFKA